MCSVTELAHGELFAGIGGFGLGFDRAGMKTIWHVEIDKDCQNVLRRHFPDCDLFGDVCECGSHNLKSVDVISFGSPCQDLSIAGKRNGLAGERSGLFHEAIRIIRELEPAIAIWENVPGSLSCSKGNDFRVVLSEMLGTDVPMPRSGRWANAGVVQSGETEVAWRILDAQHFGVPQRRRRVFVVRCTGGRSSSEILFESEGGAGHPAKGGKERKGIANTLAGGSNRAHSDMTSGQQDRNVVVAPTLDVGYYDKRYSNQQFFSQNGDGFPVVMAHGQGNAEIVSDGEPSLTRNHEAPIVFPNLTSNGDGHSGYRDEKGLVWHEHRQDESFRIQNNVSPTVSQNWGSGGGNVPFVGVRRLTPTECERLQGFPDGWTDGQADTQRYRQLGNAVAVPVVEWIGRRICGSINQTGN